MAAELAGLMRLRRPERGADVTTRVYWVCYAGPAGDRCLSEEFVVEDVDGRARYRCAVCGLMYRPRRGRVVFQISRTRRTGANSFEAQHYFFNCSAADNHQQLLGAAFVDVPEAPWVGNLLTEEVIEGLPDIGAS
jgi:hypothetical protein